LLYQILRTRESELSKKSRNKKLKTILVRMTTSMIMIEESRREIKKVDIMIIDIIKITDRITIRKTTDRVVSKEIIEIIRDITKKVVIIRDIIIEIISIVIRILRRRSL
jgi:hypothetical protein